MLMLKRNKYRAVIKQWLSLCLMLCGLLMSFSVVSAEQAHGCKTIAIHCGKTPSIVSDDQGQLWVVFEQSGHLYLVSSTDTGKTYSVAKKINAKPESIYTNGENRPKIAFGKKGELFISWTQKIKGMFAGNIRFSRSVDQGSTFSIPITINDDGYTTSHRFDQLQVSSSGLVYLVWLDKRDAFEEKQVGRSYKGAAVYYAVSSNNGKSFSKNIKVVDQSCVCCRISSAVSGNDNIAILWRHIYNKNTRDHGFAQLSPTGVKMLVRATVDEWKLDGCPHHGPDMAVGSTGQTYHMAWFSDGERHRGIYYGIYNTNARDTEWVVPVDTSASAAHPQVEVLGSRVVIVWKYFDGEKTVLRTMGSTNEGKVWGSVKTVVSTKGDSDHPQLLTHDNQLLVAWLTADEGYVIELID